MERRDEHRRRPASLSQFRRSARQAGVHWDKPADLLKLYLDYASPWLKEVAVSADGQSPADYYISEDPGLPASMTPHRTYGTDADGWQVEFDPFAGSSVSDGVDPDRRRPAKGLFGVPARAAADHLTRMLAMDDVRDRYDYIKGRGGR